MVIRYALIVMGGLGCKGFTPPQRVESFLKTYIKVLDVLVSCDSSSNDNPFGILNSVVVVISFKFLLCCAVKYLSLDRTLELDILFG